ncbi:MAG: low molecular weight protein-tyrosine-phosphatase [Saprospiraceae bacterium]
MKILMVCLGNICRSPMAQGIMESKLHKRGLHWIVDSAGTSGWHDGQNPDQRAMGTCEMFGVNISKQKSRKFIPDDLDRFDKVFAMDASNYQDILRLCQTDEHKQKVALLMNLKFPDRNMAVPDPYYSGNFEEVYHLLEDSMDDIIDHIVANG